MATDDYQECMDWIFKQQGIIESSKYGKNQRAVKDSIDELQTRSKIIKDYQKEVDKVHKKELCNKKLNNLITLMEIVSLEDTSGHISNEFDLLATDLVRPEQRVKVIGQQTGPHIPGFVSSPAQESIFATRDSWRWMQSLMKCTGVHLKNAAQYHQFFQYSDEMEDHITKDVNHLMNIYSDEEFKGDYADAKRLLQELDELIKALKQWETKTSLQWDQATRVLPVHMRTEGVPEPTPIRALCEYETNEIHIRDSEDLLLLDSTDPNLWKVRNCKGQEADVPAVVCLIPGPFSEAIEAAVRLRLRLIVVWTDTLKIIGSRLIAFMLVVFKEQYSDDEIDLIQSIPEEERDELVRIMTYIDNTLRVHWLDDENFQTLQERMEILTNIIDEVKGQPGKEKPGHLALVVQMSMIEKLMDKYKYLERDRYLTLIQLILHETKLQKGDPIRQEVWRDWLTYKAVLETVNPADLVLVVGKWEELSTSQRSEVSVLLDEEYRKMLEQEDEERLAALEEERLRKEQEEREQREQEERKRREKEERERREREERERKEREERERKEREEKERREREERERIERERKEKEEKEKKEREERERKEREEEERRKKQEEEARLLKEQKEKEERDRKEKEEKERREREERERKEREEKERKEREERERKEREEEERRKKVEEEARLLKEQKEKEEKEKKEKEEKERREREEKARKEKEEKERKEKEEKERKEKEERERKEREEKERKEKEEKERKEKEERERREREEKERKEKEEKERKEKEEKERKEKEEKERKEREEKERKEEEERERKEKEEKERKEREEKERKEKEEKERKEKEEKERKEREERERKEKEERERKEREEKERIEKEEKERKEREEKERKEREEEERKKKEEEERLLREQQEKEEKERLEREEAEQEAFETASEESMDSSGEYVKRKIAQTSEIASAEMEEKKTFVITAVFDPRSGKKVSMDEAIKEGILRREKGMYVNPVTKEEVFIPIAMNQGLIEVSDTKVKRGKEKKSTVGLITVSDPDGIDDDITYAVKHVVDARTKRNLTFQEAVQRGIIIKESGAYQNTATEEIMYIGDAIDHGFIKAQVVSDPRTYDIDPENRMVARERVKKKMLRSISVISALRKAASTENLDTDFTLTEPDEV